MKRSAIILIITLLPFIAFAGDGWQSIRLPGLGRIPLPPTMEVQGGISAA